MFLKQRLCISDLLPAKMENASLFRIASHRFLDFRATISKWSYPIAVKCHCLCSVKAMPPYRGSVCSYSTDSHQLKNFRTSTTSGHTHFSSSTCIVSNISGRPNLNESLNINLMRNIQQRHLTSSSHNRIASKENVSLKPNTAIDYIDCSDSKVLDLIKDNFLVYEDFISEEEETSILQEIEPYLNRLKYELNHWDDAIHGFRETERKKWTEKNKAIIQRVRDLAFPPDVQQLSYVHILDIKKAGYIKAHVDAVRFCGNTIAGISLLSPAVMRLVHTDNKDWFADALLKRRSLYIMRHTARYKFSHEVLSEECSRFKGEVIPRDRRISVICRNEPAPEDRH